MLSKDSAQDLLDGLHPLPRVEFEFWDARLMNLKCIHDQVTHLLHPAAPKEPRSPAVMLPPAAGSGCLCSGCQLSVERLIFSPQLNRPKVNKIVEILEKAKSCYWPALQNVYMSVTEGEPGTCQEP